VGDHLFYARNGRPMTHAEWMVKVGDLSYAHIAVTAIGEDVEVSTVWIGLDYNFGYGPPLPLETLIFGGPYDGQMWRWPNEDAALAGHDQIVALAREGVGVEGSGEDRGA
jgi:hypothetical protein